MNVSTSIKNEIKLDIPDILQDGKLKIGSVLSKSKQQAGISFQCSDIRGHSNG